MKDFIQRLRRGSTKLARRVLKNWKTTSAAVGAVAVAVAACLGTDIDPETATRWLARAETLLLFLARD